MSEARGRRPLVLGVGNFLLGDEGVGVHAARLLEGARLPGDPDVVDGGTGGLHLLSLLQEHDPVILIDATLDGRPAGTVELLRPRYASDFPRTLSAHDIGLRDLIEAAALLGPLPRLFLVAVSIEGLPSPRTDLSPAIESSLDEVARVVREALT